MFQLDSPAALSLGIDGSVGDNGVGFSAGASSSGISAGVDVSSRESGLSANGSVGSGRASSGPGAEPGGRATSTSGIGGHGTGASHGEQTATSSGREAQGSAGSNQGLAPAGSNVLAAPAEVLTLPHILLPLESGNGDSGWLQGIRLSEPLTAQPGTPLSVVQSCRNALVPIALRYGATQLDVASAGRFTRAKGGHLSAPVKVRILYRRGSLLQVRQAQVTCRMDADGSTFAVL